jgi:hypothetical protein
MTPDPVVAVPPAAMEDWLAAIYTAAGSWKC